MSSSSISTGGAPPPTPEMRQVALLQKAFEREVYNDARSLLTSYRNLLDLHSTLATSRSLGRHQDLQVSTAISNITLHSNHLLELIHELKIQALILSHEDKSL